MGLIDVFFRQGLYKDRPGMPQPPFIPGLEAALQAVAAGLGEMDVDVLPFAAAAAAHERMESRDLNGRIVLTPGPVVP